MDIVYFCIKRKLNSSTNKTVYSVLFAICMAHFINDFLQIILQISFPMFKENYALTYFQIGVITLVFQITSSVLQPLVGNYTDKHPLPYSFTIGMGFSLLGILSLSYANNYQWILISAALIGIGSSIFHPEASKLAYYVAGGRRGLAQSIFQIGGNTGTAIGPIIITAVVLHNTQKHIGIFAFVALAGIILLYYIGKWYQNFLKTHIKEVIYDRSFHPVVDKQKLISSLLILLVLIFSKYFYSASITSYLHLYLMEKFDFSIDKAQAYLFSYLAAVAIGVLIGGPIGDKFGRKFVIWFSILGVAPFTLMLPYANPTWALVLLILIGLILSSAFPSIIVYGQELLPGRTGVVSGFFYGFAFGMGGIGAAFLGNLADQYGLNQVYIWCAFLPLIGLLAAFLPNLNGAKKA